VRSAPGSTATSVVRVTPRPEAETAVEKVRFEDSLQYGETGAWNRAVKVAGGSC
jgi:hypothetical protein